MPYKFRQPLQLGELPPAAVPTIHSAPPRLEAVDAAMAEHDDTPEGEAVLNASRSLALCAKFCREKLGTSARRFFGNYREQIEGAARVFEDSFPTSGAVSGGYRDRQSAIDAQVRTTTSRFASEAWRLAGDEQKDVIEKLGTSARNAMSMAKRAIESGLARFQGPLSFRDQKFSMDDAARVGEAREEAKNMLPSRMRAVLDSLVASGDVDQEMLFTMAIKPVVSEMCSASYSKLKERFGAQIRVNGQPIAGNAPDSQERKDAIEMERRAAMETLERIEERSEELTPQSLIDAKVAYAELVSIYSVLLGWHSQVLTEDDYQLRKGRQSDVLDLHPGWATRLGIALSGAR